MSKYFVALELVKKSQATLQAKFDLAVNFRNFKLQRMTLRGLYSNCGGYQIILSDGSIQTIHIPADFEIPTRLKEVKNYRDSSTKKVFFNQLRKLLLERQK